MESKDQRNSLAFFTEDDRFIKALNQPVAFVPEGDGTVTAFTAYDALSLSWEETGLVGLALSNAADSCSQREPVSFERFWVGVYVEPGCSDVVLSVGPRGYDRLSVAEAHTAARSAIAAGWVESESTQPLSAVARRVPHAKRRTKQTRRVSAIKR